MGAECDTAIIKVLPSISEIAAAHWDACANPDKAAKDPAAAAATAFDPFVSHAFLSALEESGAVSAATGWVPQHLVLQTPDGTTLGTMPCYLKSHSLGEYIFDHGWADAYERAGGRYYPKLQVAVPFTPVPGRRFLIKAGKDAKHLREHLARGAIELARRHHASSLHITFASAEEWAQLGSTGASKDRTNRKVDQGLGLLQRTGSQFHWQNEGYRDFSDFLATLASRKRKVLRKERQTALQAGLQIHHISGDDITEQHWDQFYQFYLDTADRKWGQPYLNRKFFSLLGQKLAKQCLLIFCQRDGKIIAGALNLIGGNCLYGRYWGAIEHHPCLHFEVCYYQAIDFAIKHGLERVEAGAQGEHKLARGYQPTATYSLHWINDPGFRQAVADYLDRERRHAMFERKALAEFMPFKKTN